MRKIPLFFLLPVLAGCLSSAPLASVSWTIDPLTDQVERSPSRFGIVRVLSATVRSPFDTPPMTIVREDGSVAFDPYNHFAASPAGLIKGAAFDELRASGLFADVLMSSSSARSELALEIEVSRLTLESAGDTLRAVVETRLVLINQKERNVVGFGCGSAAEDASSGRYTEAFSKAFASSLAKALKSL